MAIEPVASQITFVVKKFSLEFILSYLQLLFSDATAGSHPISKMSLLLSWQSIVALTLILYGLPSLESLPFETQKNRPLPAKLSSIQYESICVNIYDSETISSNKKIYFYSPIALLNYKNVVTIFNQTTTRGILSISFSIWNQNVDDKVAQHLSEILNQQIGKDQVQVFPFESVKLTSKVQSVDYSLTNEWLMYKNESSLRFSATCPTWEDCDRVKTQMRINPKQFENLRLDFNPQLNDDTCFNDGVETFQGDLAEQVKEFTQLLEEIKSYIKEDWTNSSKALEDAEKLNRNLQVALENLETTKSELTQTKTIVGELSAKLDKTQQELEATKMALASTRIELGNTSSTVNDLSTKLSARTRKIVDIGKMPSSCGDLQRMGHKLSGFFSVQGTKKIETVYCDFYPNENDLQKWIGYADVESAPVYFYVTRSSSFNTTGIPIPFDLMQLNVGNAMNLTSGKFTAIRTGIYFFSFTGSAEFPDSPCCRVQLGVGLYRNGDRIGTGWVEEANSLATQDSPLTVQSTLSLNKGDQVWVQIETISSGVSLLDWNGHQTHFTGFMLEEDIVASL